MFTLFTKDMVGDIYAVTIPTDSPFFLGPVVRVSPEEVDIADIDAVKEIHKVGGRYLKAGFYTHIGHRSAKTLFSTTDPKFHAVRRRLLSSPLSESSLVQLESLVVDRVRLCIVKMSEEMKTRNVTDVFKWWTFMATDIIGELSFGESFRMLEHGKVSWVESLSGLWENFLTDR